MFKSSSKTSPSVKHKTKSHKALLHKPQSKSTTTKHTKNKQTDSNTTNKRSINTSVSTTLKKNKSKRSQSLTNNTQLSFSTSVSSSVTLPKIPKLSYLRYDETTDVLALLKKRGFMNQTTADLDKHFNSQVDLSPESISACLNALTGQAVPAGEGESAPMVVDATPTLSPLYKSTQDNNSDITTLRSNNKFQRRAVYAGFDPTASSLHLGNLLVILSLMHFARAGHQVVALTGGATGMVGDPSGRSTERVLQSADQVKHNVSQINQSLLRLLQLPSSPITLIDQNNTTTTSVDSHMIKPIFVDNFDWYHNMSVIDFLRDIGKHFRVSNMLSKDSVKSRMSTDGDGISFTEFSYQVLQGYDYNHLHQRYGVSLQVGGSDQWGNITAGIDCIHRTKSHKQQQEQAIASAASANGTNNKDGKNKKKNENKENKNATATTVDSTTATAAKLDDDDAHGLTLPLLTTAQGVKFGKSMGNAIWINPSMTSSYQLYQYLLSTNDLDCKKFLNVFTFLTNDTIDNIMSEHAKLPDARIPQRILGCEIVRLLHGDIGVKQALAATKLLFKDKFVVDMSHYTRQFESTEHFESFETNDTTTIGNTNDNPAVTTDNNNNDPTIYDGLGFDDYLASLNGVPITHLPALSTVDPELLTKPDTHPYSIVNLAVSMKLCASKSEARRLIKNNGLSIFQEKVTDESMIITPELCTTINAPFNRIVMIKSGQKKIHMAVLPTLE